MKNIGKITIFLIVITAILFGIYFAGNQGWLKNTPLKNLDYQALNFFGEESASQTKVLTERAKQTSEEVQHVLGDQIKVDEEGKEKALHEKAIEYGQYLYCKQVVDDWETKLQP